MKLILTAALGIALLVWTVASVGITQLMSQFDMLGLILPLALALAAFRFALQAAGWRLAMLEHYRPSLLDAVLAVIAGEAAGYLAWGPISREPVKAMMIRRHTPERVSLTAALAERIAYTGAAAGLVIAGLVILAVRTNHPGWIAIGSALSIVVVGIGLFVWRRPLTAVSAGRVRPGAMLGLVGVAAMQELTNVFEAFVVLSWLGASPTLEIVIAFEGLSRLANSAGQFIPGKIGVNELAGAGLANLLSLGSVHGLTLALARRVRSLVWAGVGVVLLTVSAVRPSLKVAA
jgi:hypothetical protein